MIIPSWLGEWFWINFLVPPALKKFKINIFDSIWGGGLPTFPKQKPCFYVTTYHDFIELDFLKEKMASKSVTKSMPKFIPLSIRPNLIANLFNKLKEKIIKGKIIKNFRVADKVVFLNQSMRKKFLEHFEYLLEYLPAALKEELLKKIVLSPNGITYPPRPVNQESLEKLRQLKSQLKEKHGIDKYFLYVGGFNKRKNVEKLILAYASFLKSKKKVGGKVGEDGGNSKGVVPPLVIVGKANTYFKKKILPLIKEGEDFIRENLIHLGYVDEAYLDLLYRETALFFYPSLMEGFGMPPLEALSQGKFVVVDDKLPLNAWNFSKLIKIDMNSLEAMVAVIKNWDEIKASKFKEKSRTNDKADKALLEKLSWSNIAKEYYQKVIYPLQ